MLNIERLDKVNIDLLKQKKYINQILININPKICIPILKELYFHYNCRYNENSNLLIVDKPKDLLFYYKINSDKVSFQFSVAAFESIFDILYKQSTVTNSSYEYIIENNNHNYYIKSKKKKIKKDRKLLGRGFIHYTDVYDSKTTYTINLNEGIDE